MNKYALILSIHIGMMCIAGIALCSIKYLAITSCMLSSSRYFVQFCNILFIVFVKINFWATAVFSLSCLGFAVMYTWPNCWYCVILNRRSAKQKTIYFLATGVFSQQQQIQENIVEYLYLEEVQNRYNTWKSSGSIFIHLILHLLNLSRNINEKLGFFHVSYLWSSLSNFSMRAFVAILAVLVKLSQWHLCILSIRFEETW